MAKHASIKTTPYEIFEKAIRAGIKPTIEECWPNFACWESARNFGDDPSHLAKAAIEWIYTMENLRADLDQFEGEAKVECMAALNEAYVAYAKLEHSDELIAALGKWMEYRLDE